MTDLRAMVQRAIQAGKSLDEVSEHIAEQIHDYAWLQCNPQFEDYGPFNYNAHESTDSGNTKLNFSMTEIKDQLLIYLREHHPEFLGNL
jgi:hypothetical protein